MPILSTPGQMHSTSICLDPNKRTPIRLTTVGGDCHRTKLYKNITYINSNTINDIKYTRMLIHAVTEIAPYTLQNNEYVSEVILEIKRDLRGI